MPRAVLALAVVLSPACLDPTTNLDTSSSATSSSTSDASTSTTGSSSSSDDSSSSDTSSSTGTPPPCDDDPACGPDEDVGNCPEQCNVCGDSVVVSPETCDNGTNIDPAYSPTPPGPDTCTADCQLVAFCGDDILNGPEPCDSTNLQTAACEADCRTPTCGDGTLNALAGEACDDSNVLPGDGCSEECTVERRVFVSSAVFEGDLRAAIDNPDMLAGIPLADARCNALALAVGLPQTFKAWLSDDNLSPASRFDTSFSGLYRLLSPDFPIVATGWPGLTAGSLAHAIDADETGVIVVLQANVLTNTAPDGTSASDQHCSAFTANDDTSTTIGKSSASDATWTSLGESFCSNSYRIYCFEDP